MNTTCKDCGKPVHWANQGTEDGGAWYHDELIDTIACPGEGMTEPAGQYAARHITDEELGRRIAANYVERTATHQAMIDPLTLEPHISPLSEKWRVLGDRYVALADESGRLYAELCRREATNA